MALNTSGIFFNKLSEKREDSAGLKSWFEVLIKYVHDANFSEEGTF